MTQELPQTELSYKLLQNTVFCLCAQLKAEVNTEQIAPRRKLFFMCTVG